MEKWKIFKEIRTNFSLNMQSAEIFKIIIQKKFKEKHG